MKPRWWIRFKQWRRDRRTPPHIEISYFGWETEVPHVNVSAFSTRGSMSIYTYAADDVGEARASMHGELLSRILNVPLVDRRATQWLKPSPN